MAAFILLPKPGWSHDTNSLILYSNIYYCRYDAEDEALRNEQFQAALREFEALDLEEANYEAEEKAKQNERAAPFVLSSQEIQQDVRRFRKHVTVSSSASPRFNLQCLRTPA